MLGLSILAVGFAWISVYEVYQLSRIKKQTIPNKTYMVISKPVEEDTKNLISINVYPGNTIQNICEQLEKNGIISKEEFSSYLKKNQIILEGIVFEGKYSIPVPTTSKEICSILIKPYEDWMKNEYKRFKDIGKTPFEIITIASMIEKEAAEDSERSVIAGVIYNRLKNNMKLQIDATVIYALGKHKTRLLNEDLKIDSPYNTYIIQGLPPGPICVPRKSSIEAALNPDMHSYFYYVVSAYGSKRHFFAETYDEHLNNVAKYKTTIK